MKNLLFFLVLLFGCVCTGCKFLAEPEKENIVPKAPLYDFTFELDSALTGDGSQSLPKDKSGFYHLKMWENSFQTLSRITGRFLWNGKPNPRPSPVGVWIEWKSSHFWVLNKNSPVIVVYKTYFNPFTGKLQTVELGTLKAQGNSIVPTINGTSYASSDGSVNTIFGPIFPMKGDTVTITAICHLTKEIPTGRMFARIEKDSISRNMRIICE
jgi:hypothetical protein